jgi:peptidoglycan hydrolase CwlO-like protein
MTERPPSSSNRRRGTVVPLAVLVAGLVCWLPSVALASTLKAQLADTRAQLQRDRSRQADLSTAIERYAGQIDRLSAQVAGLREREARVQVRLAEKEAALRRAKARLARLRIRLRAAMKVLRERLVAVYESDQPDALTVILDSRGFNQLASRSAYLSTIEQQDEAIVAKVRTLRNETRATVNRIRAARERLAAERATLAHTRSRLNAQAAALGSTRDRKQRALSQIRSNGRRLQGEISDLQDRIEAAQAPPPSPSGLTGSTAAPLGTTLGPVPAGQAISPFPASSPVSWGRTDQGVDGTTTPGSPLLAMGTGTVTIGHDPAGFGASYPIIHTAFGDFYYGHCVPTVADGAGVSIDQPIATAHTGTWGNSTTPGGFEIGAWPPGDMTAGAAIRSWLIGLPRR